jgi:hypothetical protein
MDKFSQYLKCKTQNTSFQSSFYVVLRIFWTFISTILSVFCCNYATKRLASHVYINAFVALH